MGVILLFQLTQPDANLWTTTTLNFGIPYWAISIGLNVLVTSMIVARLFMIRRRTSAVLSANHTKTYTSVAAMLVESAALYSITALIFIITYARNSNIQNLVLPVLGQVQAISPLLIMWRVALGQAITRTTLPGTATAGASVSKLSWKNNGGATGATLASRGATTTLTNAQTVSLPSYGGKKGAFAGDEDSDNGWELSERSSNKTQGVEIVVEREVGQWDGNGQALHPSHAV